MNVKNLKDFFPLFPLSLVAMALDSRIKKKTDEYVNTEVIFNSSKMLKKVIKKHNEKEKCSLFQQPEQCRLKR